MTKDSFALGFLETLADNHEGKLSDVTPLSSKDKAYAVGNEFVTRYLGNKLDSMQGLEVGAAPNISEHFKNKDVLVNGDIIIDEGLHYAK